MSGRIPIGIAFAGNCAVASATYATYGWNAAAAHAAARNTARYSGLWFTLVFATPALAHWFRALPREAKLIHAFVAAHIVHFTTVGILLATFDSPHVSQNFAQAAVVVILGSAVVVGVGLTAAPRASRLYTAVHQILPYAVFLIFLVAFATKRPKSLRVLAVALGIALILRLTSTMRQFTNGTHRHPAQDQ